MSTSYWTGSLQRQISRRRALGAAGGSAAAVALLAACSGGSSSKTTSESGGQGSGLIVKVQDETSSLFALTR